jgi:Phosphotransferase enzyme family
MRSVELLNSAALEVRIPSLPGFASGGPARISILDRIQNPSASTWPSEVVTCRADGNGLFRLLLKYSTAEEHRNVHGNPVGPAYEATVYEHVLGRSSVCRNIYRGAWRGNGSSCITCLFLDYLDGTSSVSKTANARPLCLAAGWLGAFHAEQEALVEYGISVLNPYDAAYYRGWAERTLAFGRPLRRRFPWLTEVCQEFDGLLHELTATEPTVIHGEFYPSNVLFRDGRLWPIDWEWAGLGPGEIDLAALTEGRWLDETIEECKRAYVAARWGGLAPPNFERALDAARVYLHLRWLGGRPDRPAMARAVERCEQLREVSERLALV